MGRDLISFLCDSVLFYFWTFQWVNQAVHQSVRMSGSVWDLREREVGKWQGQMAGKLGGETLKSTRDSI